MHLHGHIVFRFNGNAETRSALCILRSGSSSDCGSSGHVDVGAGLLPVIAIGHQLKMLAVYTEEPFELWPDVRKSMKLQTFRPLSEFQNRFSEDAGDT